MTDASLPVFAALATRCAGPSSGRRGPRRPGVRLPDVRTLHPRMRAWNSRSHAYGAPPPDRGLTVPLEPRQDDGRRTRPP